MSVLDSVCALVPLRLLLPGLPSVPVTVTLQYDAGDPWAVKATFRETDGAPGEVEWLLGRQLLTDGLVGSVGDGDVAIWPVREAVRLALSSPSGSALVEADRNDLMDFLQRTYLVVPTGQEPERVDLDAELALLLA